MAKISTRPADQDEQSTIERLQEILYDATAGAIGTAATARLQVGSDVGTLLDTIEGLIGLLNRTASRLFVDLAHTTNDNMILTVKLEEAMNVLESFMDISYDEALDHATMDLMDAFAASGGADVTANGELGFDGSVMYSKSDLKPILREAISRYVDVKLS